MKKHNSDNVRVLEDEQSNEFLLIGEKTVTDSETVFLYRYCVPGRCDTYGFGFIPSAPGRSSRVTYWSEGDVAMPVSLALLLEDLEKPAVVKMFTNFVETSLSPNLMILFLESLAPDAAAVKAFREKYDERVKARREARARKATGNCIEELTARLHAKGEVYHADEEWTALQRAVDSLKAVEALRSFATSAVKPAQ